MVSLPVPALIVVAILGPVIVSLPVFALMVRVSLPLVKVPAVIVAKVAVSPDPTVITRLDVPVAVSFN